MSRLVFKVIFIIIIPMVFQSCNSDDNIPPDCGCNSETVDTVPSDNFPEVPDEEQKSGLLFYKTAEKIDNIFDTRHDGKYNNTFWIFRGVEGCYNCKQHFIICNEDFLDANFEYLKILNDSIPISFTGDLKHLCVDPFVAPADYLYIEISLNSIEER